MVRPNYNPERREQEKIREVGEINIVLLHEKTGTQCDAYVFQKITLREPIKVIDDGERAVRVIEEDKPKIMEIADRIKEITEICGTCGSRMYGSGMETPDGKEIWY